MLHQISFFDFDAPPSNARPSTDSDDQEPTGRVMTLFFGLMPVPTDALVFARHAGEWSRQFHVGGTLRTADTLHVSLQAIGGYVGKVPAESLEFGKRIGGAISARSFDIAFDRVMSFKGKNPPFVLLVGEGVECIRAFRQTLGIVIANAGGAREDRKFKPHMTPAYGKHLVPEHPVEPIRWKVRDFALIVSHYGESRYKVIHRWPLQD